MDETSLLQTAREEGFWLFGYGSLVWKVRVTDWYALHAYAFNLGLLSCTD